MQKRPRFINYPIGVSLMRISNPRYSFRWQDKKTAVLVYELPNTNYLHYSVRKRSMHISTLPF